MQVHPHINSTAIDCFLDRHENQSSRVLSEYSNVLLAYLDGQPKVEPSERWGFDPGAAATSSSTATGIVDISSPMFSFTENPLVKIHQSIADQAVFRNPTYLSYFHDLQRNINEQVINLNTQLAFHPLQARVSTEFLLFQWSKHTKRSDSLALQINIDFLIRQCREDTEELDVDNESFSDFLLFLEESNWDRTPTITCDHDGHIHAIWKSEGHDARLIIHFGGGGDANFALFSPHKFKLGKREIFSGSNVPLRSIKPSLPSVKIEPIVNLENDNLT